MIKISKQNNSLIVEGIDNVFYPNNGDNSYPLNSLIVVTDNSDMATFRSVATNDVLFSGLINNITINGEVVTKDNIITKFDAVSNSTSTGGGGGSVDAYTKTESDAKYATKDELTAVETVANDADLKADNATSRIESVETSLGNKQDTLVSGTNIKTINNQSILGEGNIEISDYYTKTEADEIFATTTQVNHQAADISALQTDMRGKQATLVSGTNIKTINGESVLGEGNIEVAKKTDIPSTDNLATKDELTAVETVANNADAKADAATSRIESVETAMGNKQDTLVSGTNIKTINSQSIIGSGDLAISGVSEEQAQEIAKIPTLETALNNKQDTLVSGTNIKTINSQSILGEGNIIIEGSGGIKTYEASEIPSVLLKELKEAVSNAVTKRDYSKYTTTDVTPISQFLSNLSNGDYLKLYNSNEHKLQFVGNKIIGTDFYYYFNIIVVGTGTTKIYSNYITVTVLSSQIYVGNNKSVEVAKITDIPNTDNFATKDELTAVETSLGNKQDTLVSGTNIKTINSQSIIGSGDLTISGVSDEQAQEIAKIPTIETELAQKANVSDVPTAQTGYQGTNKKYIYSEGNIDDNNKTVVSNIVSIIDNTDTVKLGIYEWGGSMGKVIKLPSATTTLAGVMSAADKTKLDSVPETIPSQSEIDGIAADVSALQTAMDGKQPTLVSGTNIKTINGNSILGEGNINIEGGDIDLSNYYNKTEVDTKLDTKQNTLVSGTNIKTVNSQSILGEGNIEVTIPDATTATSGAMSAADKTKLDSLSTEWTGTQSEFDALTTKDNNTIYYVTE